MRPLTKSTLRLGTRALIAKDPDLAAIVRRLGVPPFWGRHPGFPTLVRIILEQQVSLAAARTMYERLAVRARSITPDSLIDLGVSGLRTLGFTGQKAACGVHLAESIRSGGLDLGAVARAETESSGCEGVRTLPPARGWRSSGRPGARSPRGFSGRTISTTRR